MPLEIGIETQEQEVLKGFVCNKCKKYISSEDIMEFQEMFYYKFTGGYISAWGDMNEVEIVLCSSCSYDVLSDYAYINDLSDYAYINDLSKEEYDG